MELCDYGCGKEAKHQFNNGKWCCSEFWQACSGIKKIKIPWNKNKTNIFSTKTIKNMSIAASKRTGEKNPFYNKHHTIEARKVISKKGKGKIPWNKDKTGVYDIETLENIRLGALLTIPKIKEKYPTFIKVEEMRYNPYKPGEKEIQVHCKNHNCPNSKEQNGWFTPNKNQFYDRRRALEDSNGNDGAYFYCCEDCKVECPLYYLNGDPNKNNKKLYSPKEYQTFRQTVLERENYICEYCEESANTVHHSRPQKLEPGFVLDPDFGIACCEKCHYKYGHKDECSTGALANKICL